jgi:pimeloyl-ACP methyl ester carboxylesterase
MSNMGEPGNYPIGNPPVLSGACGTATTISTGERTINSTNQDRVYYIDIPDDYDMNKPYRLFYISHWIGSRYQDMVNNNFYGLKTKAEAAGERAIFIAPSSDGSTWQEKDHALFDDLLAFAKENLCFDTSRVFATGFSFGGMITYSLSTNHQEDIRAAVGIAPANYNIWLPTKTRQPIAWMQTTGMSDTTCPWDQNGSTNGAKWLAQEKAEDNGCTMADIPTWQNGDHLCYDFEGCGENTPTKVCTFNGGHQAEHNDSTSNNWIPDVSWDFFTQF